MKKWHLLNNPKKRKFRIEITSVPDRNILVAEIWFGEKHIAEINQESDEMKIELYRIFLNKKIMKKNSSKAFYK